MKSRIGVLIVGLATGLSACSDNDDKGFAYPPAGGARIAHEVIDTATDASGATVEVRKGGFGSAMIGDPDKAGYFYALTDRGPNVATAAGVTPSGIIFVTPSYTPRIGHFRLNDKGEVEKLSEILLKDPSGRAISGLPNQGFGATGETPYLLGGGIVSLDPDGDGVTGYDEYGLDGEGLVALRDGTFWVSDEYGPHMVHFDAGGKEIERINPFQGDSRNKAGRRLPAELGRRWPNRGMEGLAITPDEKTLVGIMQSGLDNPSSAARNTDLTRIVTINVDTGATQQYLYRQEANGHSNSELSALTASTYLVLERDQKFFGRDGDTGTGTGAGKVFKRLYKIDLAGATNVDRSNTTLIDSQAAITDGGDLGLLVDGKTLEQYIKDNGNAGWTTLADLGIVPVSKTLAYDAITALSYPHDKMEGVWVIDATTVGILNDNDFALEPDGVGGVKQKILSTGEVDTNILHLVKLSTPLY